MDFDQAVATHSKWKRRLRDYLFKHDGSLHPNEVSLDHKCELGEWIYGEGAAYSALPEFTRLKYEHARFHAAAAEIVRKANSGDPATEEVQPCSSSEFSTASAAVVIALMSMKKQVSK
jgi:hypothetical protein